MPESTWPGCGLTLPTQRGPTHRYVVSSLESPQHCQSVALHLITLNAVPEIGQSLETTCRITQAAGEVGRMEGGYRTLNRPSIRRSTIVGVASAETETAQYMLQVLDSWLETEQPSIDEWTDRTLGRLYAQGSGA